MRALSYEKEEQLALSNIWVPGVIALMFINDFGT